MKSIVCASDHAGYKLKQTLVMVLNEKGYNVLDLGCFSDDEKVDYPDYANKLALELLNNKEVGMGFLTCGSGIGISISANRHNHIRCALVKSVEEAISCREHNDSNVIAMGERFIDTEEAIKCLLTFLKTSFSGGRHINRVNKLS